MNFRDAILTSIINLVTCLLSGFVIFSTLGYMSIILDKHISEVAGDGGIFPQKTMLLYFSVFPSSGPGLVFIVYPQAIATMDYAPFWAVIFFFMLITLGIDSTVNTCKLYRFESFSFNVCAFKFAGLEALVTAFCDEFPNVVGKYREWFVLVLVIYCYTGTLPTTTYVKK